MFQLLVCIYNVNINYINFDFDIYIYIFRPCGINLILYSSFLLLKNIVLSSNETASFMLDCIHAGAADYILKPMRLDVVKTLFLVSTK